MRSETGAILTRISAAINFVIAGLALIVSQIIFISTQSIPVNTGIMAVIIALVSAGIGYLFWRAAKMMLDEKKVRKGAIWAIVLGVRFIVNISGIISLIGGIIALVDSNK